MIDCSEFLDCNWHRVALNRHCPIVEHNREDSQVVANGSLKVHAHHAYRCIAHDVHAELVWLGQFRAHRDAQTVTQLGRFSPTLVGSWRHSLPERDQLVSRTAGIVGDDSVGPVDEVHQVPDNAVLIQWSFVGGEVGHPFVEPILLDSLNFGRGGGVVPVADSVGLSFDLRDHGLKHELGVTDEGQVGLVIFVHIGRVVGRVDNHLAVRDSPTVTCASQARPDTEHYVGAI